MSSMKTILSATAVSIVMAGSAHAVCNPSPAISGGDTLTLNAQDCHLVIQSPAVLPLSPSTEFVIRDPSTGEIGSDGGAVAGIVIGAYNSLDGRLDTVEGAVGTQGGQIATLQTDKADKSYVDQENQDQDDIIATKADQTALNTVEQDSKDRDTALDNKKVDKVRLDTFKPTGAVAPYSTLENWAGGVNSTLGAHTQQITANTALLSEHTARLDEQAKGLAIAMAMPDAWLGDKKRFGIFGAVGGFEGETALGFAAIGRLDETWSLNAKVGADTEFDHVGWQVGVGAQW